MRKHWEVYLQQRFWLELLKEQKAEQKAEQLWQQQAVQFNQSTEIITLSEE